MTLSSPPATELMVGDGRVAIVDRAGVLQCWEQASAKGTWSVSLGSSASGPPTIDRRQVHVGTTDGQVMGDRRQLRASLRLTRWLQSRFGISTDNVIGHAESLSSPYHQERVGRLRNQTHGDMSTSTMTRYRRLLSRSGS